MPWNNQAVSLIVIEEEVTGFSGLFGYSPAPGRGKLIFSIAAGPGTDPFGNAYLGGIASYVPGGIEALLSGAALGMGSQNPATTIVGESGGLRLTDALSAAAQPAVQLQSPQTTANGPRAIINLIGQSQNGDATPQIVVAVESTSPAVPFTPALLEVQGNQSWNTGSKDGLYIYRPAGGGADDAAAINELLADGIGVQLLPVNYHLVSGPILANLDNPRLWGSVFGFGTSLICGFTSSQPGMLIAGDTQIIQHADFRDLQLSGNQNADSGHGLISRSENPTYQNITSSWTAGDAFHFSTGDLNSNFYDSATCFNLYADFPAGYGLWTDQFLTSSEFYGCHFAGGSQASVANPIQGPVSPVTSPFGLYGMYLQGANLKHYGCHPFHWPLGGAMFTGNANYALAMGGEYETNSGPAMTFDGVSWGRVIGTTHYGGTGSEDILLENGASYIRIAEAAFNSSGVTLAVSGDGTVSHCSVINCISPAAKGITFASGADYQIITLNDLDGAAITHSGAHDYVPAGSNL